jgi:UDP-N-acetylmuramate--alanine ligase
MIEQVEGRHIHLVGIGGAGMSGIAEVLLNLGCEVTGSDLVATEVTSRLSSLGAKVMIGHHPENLSGADVVVTSSAIGKENPEVIEAKRQGIPIIPRAEMLRELMRLKYGIAITGSHGKTTTTSLVSWILAKGGLDPTMVIGGRFINIGASGRLGRGKYLVVEADESDGSFLRLLPIVVVVTNIDYEHLDHFGDLDEAKKAFLAFINDIPFYGKAVLCEDDPHIREILPRVERRFITYGIEREAHIRAKEVHLDGLYSEFDVVMEGKVMGRVRINVPGLHYINNALAAIWVGLELGVDFHLIDEALRDFHNVERRFQLLGEEKGVIFLDDYAHHPTEIISTIKAAKIGFGDRRFIAIFQPHRYTRTKLLWREFGDAFDGIDILIITSIYPAGEAKISGVDAGLIVEATKKTNPWVEYIEGVEEVPSRVMEIIKEGDLVMTLGAGDVWKVSREVLNRLRDDKERDHSKDQGHSSQG